MDNITIRHASRFISSVSRLKWKVPALFVIAALIVFVTLSPIASAPANASPSFAPHLQTANIVVDHTSVALFEQIPDEYIEAAATLDMFFMDRSVGGNINDGLSCLNYVSDEAAPSHCKRYEHVDPVFSVDPSEVNWSRVGGYDRSNWDFEYWPTGMSCASWSEKVDCFINYIEPQIGGYDVVSFQFSYLAVDESDTIADQLGGFFSDNANLTDVYDFEDFEARNPGKETIYWTTSLSRGIGTTVSESFNNQMRQYATTNGKILFDVADILSHDPSGNPCYDNRDGVPYDNGNHSENYPDDGQQIPSICQHYTTEVDGGHLGSVSAGKIRVAKAFWVLMAQIAGWDPGTTPASVFEDVPSTHWAFDEINALYEAGYVFGCSSDPLLYCPENILNRAESSVFVLRGQYGTIANPPYPAPSTPTFSDVSSSHWGYGWIESLWTDGYTAGCSENPLMYCPDGQHTRAEASVFFVRVKNGASYEPPEPTGIFNDVDINAWYAGWVEASYNEGLLPACNLSPLEFCPEDLLDRAWAAYMMVQAKGGLPLP